MKKGIPDVVEFKEVREQAFTVIDKEELTDLASSLIRESIDEKALEWTQIDKMIHRVKIHLRPLLLSIDWDYHPSYSALVKAIAELMSKLKKALDFTLFGVGQLSPLTLRR